MQNAVQGDLVPVLEMALRVGEPPSDWSHSKVQRFFWLVFVSRASSLSKHPQFHLSSKGRREPSLVGSLLGAHHAGT